MIIFEPRMPVSGSFSPAARYHGGYNFRVWTCFTSEFVIIVYQGSSTSDDLKISYSLPPYPHPEYVYTSYVYMVDN